MSSKISKLLFSVSMISSSIHAGEMGLPYQSRPQGFFIGLGASYNSLNLNQAAWGLGTSNVVENSIFTSQGIAQGNAAPFKNTTLTFSPEIQAGYLKNYNSDTFFGLKFTYQYLGLSATNRDLYLPQTGELRTVSTSAVNPMFGYAIADSVETTINHNMNLFALMGKQWGNKYFYLGAGPSVLSIKSRNYNSIGYAILDGATINVTGLVNYGSPTIWAWGGAAQVGMSYFIDSAWFLDASYTYSLSGTYTTRHEQSYINSSTIGDVSYTTSGILATKTTFKSTALQFVNLSINRMIDM